MKKQTTNQNQNQNEIKRSRLEWLVLPMNVLKVNAIVILLTQFLFSLVQYIFFANLPTPYWFWFIVYQVICIIASTNCLAIFWISIGYVVAGGEAESQFREWLKDMFLTNPNAMVAFSKIMVRAFRLYGDRMVRISEIEDDEHFKTMVNMLMKSR